MEVLVPQLIPACQRLIAEGFFTSKEEASRWILAGKVRVGDTLITSAGQLISKNQPLMVRGFHQQYVSKGGLKLEGALRAFPVSVKDRVCIDAGASTGGFTDCLLQHQARLVYAVDVGYGQLAGSLRKNPRVVNMERTNISDDTLQHLDPVPTLGTIDLSYLSLRKAVPQFAKILGNQGDLIALVKPLFEIADPLARRTGQIDDNAYTPLLKALIQSLTDDGFPVSGLTHSPVTGNQGTIEFFLWISLGPNPPMLNPSSDIDAIVSEALALPLFRKEQANT